MLFAMIRGDGLDAKTGLPWADASLDAHALPKRGPNCAGERSRKTAPPPSVAPSWSSALMGCSRFSRKNDPSPQSRPPGPPSSWGVRVCPPRQHFGDRQRPCDWLRARSIRRPADSPRHPRRLFSLVQVHRLFSFSRENGAAATASVSAAAFTTAVFSDRCACKQERVCAQPFGE